MIRGHMVSHVIMFLAMEQLENGIPIASLGELCEPEKALQTNPRVSEGTSCDAQSVQLGDHRCPEAVEIVPARAIRKDWPGLGHFELGGRHVAELAFEMQQLGGHFGDRLLCEFEVLNVVVQGGRHAFDHNGSAFDELGDYGSAPLQRTLHTSHATVRTNWVRGSLPQLLPRGLSRGCASSRAGRSHSRSSRSAGASLPTLGLENSDDTVLERLHFCIGGGVIVVHCG